MEIKLINKENFYTCLDMMVDLFNDIFKIKVDRDYFIWRYINNPIGDLLMVVAMDEGNIVSSYSALPIYLQYHDYHYKSALSIHTMTHIDYRGKGLFERTGIMFYEQLRKKGYKMLIGFPNSSVHPALNKKLQRIDIYEFPTMSLKIDKSEYEDIGIEFDDGFLLDYDQIQRDKNKISVKKDVRYLRWRYSQCPSTKYRNIVIRENESVKAYFILKQYDKKVNIVDYFVNSQNDVDVLINHAKTYAHNQKADYVTTWANINTDLKLILEKEGFSHSLPITYFSGKILDDDCPLNYHINDWHIVMGDDNVY